MAQSTIYQTESHPVSTTQTIQVVLEYQWTDSRDLIENLKVTAQTSSQPSEKQHSEDPTGEPVQIQNKMQSLTQIKLSSVLQSLAVEGFEMEADQRISYFNTEKKLYVYLGRVGDGMRSEAQKLPEEAFSQQGFQKQVTLLVREPSTGMSGVKPLSTSLVASNSANLGQPQQLFAPANDHSAKDQSLFSPEKQLPTAQSFAPSQYEIPTQADSNLTRGVSFGDFKPAAEASATDTARQADSFQSPAQRVIARHSQMRENDLQNVDLSLIDSSKRTKERQIKFVVERVSLWRKLYNGVDLGTGETVRYSLEDSARLVGISKKSLDDYLLQLRFGRMYGFDFLHNQSENIGVLRKFVRDKKNQQKRQRQQNQSLAAAKTAPQSTNSSTVKDLSVSKRKSSQTRESLF